MDYKENKDKWVVCHNGKDVYHILEYKANMTISTGQPKMDKYDTEEEMLVALPDKVREEYLARDEDNA